MQMIITGSGTSHGVPVIDCNCAVCTSDDPKNKRLRSAAWVKSPASIIIDTGPEFRIQALKFKIHDPDCVLLTHNHADHLNGLDDLRVFSHTKSADPLSPTPETEGDGLSIYASKTEIKAIKKRFDYIFTPVTQGGGKPKLNLICTSGIDGGNPLKVKGVSIIPIPIMHGNLKVNGYLLTEEKDGHKKSIAYLTDCNSIPEASFQILKDYGGEIEHLVIDALREKTHSSHFSFLEAMAASDRIMAKHTWFIHMTHNMDHYDIQRYIDHNLDKFPNLKSIVENGGSVCPSCDGLEIET
ncbi:MAG: MBL fold metallo-hydrolase [Treponema sp.]|nr:MBL fold metallo-hydrolase [Treponema sp.]